MCRILRNLGGYLVCSQELWKSRVILVIRSHAELGSWCDLYKWCYHDSRFFGILAQSFGCALVRCVASRSGHILITFRKKQGDVVLVDN